SDLGWGNKSLLKEPFKPPSDINPDVNQALDMLISKTLDFQPSGRFHNAVELLDALDEWKPRTERGKPKALPSEMSKTALGVEGSWPNEHEAEEMAKRATNLKKQGKLADAADLM